MDRVYIRTVEIEFSAIKFPSFEEIYYFSIDFFFLKLSIWLIQFEDFFSGRNYKLL